MFYFADQAEVEIEQNRWIVEPRWINLDRLSIIYYKDDAAYFIIDNTDLPDNVVLSNRFRVQMNYEEFSRLL